MACPASQSAYMANRVVIVLKLRKKAAQLSPAELSNFLCSTVLIGGVNAMAPMIFFTLDSLSYFASDKIEDNQCHNTLFAGLCLSVYVVITTLFSISSKAMSREERGKGLTYVNPAILRLKKRQRIQGGLDWSQH